MSAATSLGALMRVRDIGLLDCVRPLPTGNARFLARSGLREARTASRAL
jgi:hypothetical protein